MSPLPGDDSGRSYPEPPLSFSRKLRPMRPNPKVPLTEANTDKAACYSAPAIWKGDPAGWSRRDINARPRGVFALWNLSQSLDHIGNFGPFRITFMDKLRPDNSLLVENENTGRPLPFSFPSLFRMPKAPIVLLPGSDSRRKVTSRFAATRLSVSTAS